MTSTTRRIQLTGGSTYIISLPSRWVKSNNLSKGSEVNIDEQNGDLIVSGQNAKRAEVTKYVNLSDDLDMESLERALTAFYISNFDSLVLRSSGYISQNFREEIKKFSKLVMGVEIFEESSKTMVLQNVLDSASFPLSKAVRRMSLNVSTMIADVIKGFTENDTELLENVTIRDDDVDRYQWYVYREVKRNSSDNPNSIFYLIFSRILERIADHAVNLCRIWKTKTSLDKIPLDKILDNLEKSYEMYEQATEAFYSGNFGELNRIISQKSMIVQMKRDLLNLSGKNYDLSTLASSSEEILRIGLYATDIAELTMDMILSNKDEISL